MRCFPVIFELISLLPVAVQGQYNLTGPEGPIEAQVGSDVVLPCSVKPPVDVTDATVEWMFNSSKTVHLFRNEDDDRGSQDESYKDRTILNHKMLKDGDVSLKLANVTKNDAGIYTCIVPRLPGHKSEKRNITLVVVDGKENENPDRHSGADDPESQDESYKNRTILNHTMIEHGNGSLTLTNGTKNDAGNYTCIVPRQPGQDNSEERNITPVVDDGKENENPDNRSGGTDPGVNGCGVGCVVGVVVSLIILIIIIYCVVRLHRGEPIFPCWSNNSRNEEVRNDGGMEMEELQNPRGNGNQGDEAEAEPLQNQEEPN